MKVDHRWLDRWMPRLDGLTVLELGCGEGIDSAILRESAGLVVSSDIDQRDGWSGGGAYLVLDHSKPLPFKAEAFDVVVVSLSLHYFSWDTTEKIVSEISRVLKSGGLLICRLNSTKDVNYGATGYPEIEPGLHEVYGGAKRFFTAEDIALLFRREWLVKDVQHKVIDRYALPKAVWEFSAVNA